MSMPASRINSSKTVAALLKGLADAPDIPVAGITSDSRQVDDGYLFVACQGATTHGLTFARAAAKSGAAAIAYDSTTAPAVPEGLDIPLVAVADLGRHIGVIANRFFDYPSSDLKVVGVTGTNGKTTVAWLLADCLKRLGEGCGYIGTLGYGVNRISADNGMTTPDAIELHRRLAGFRDLDCTYAAIEVSSHALTQRRTDGVSFDTALFTNLSRDHLDYHGNMRAYGEAKASLFLTGNPKHRIVNIDTDFGLELANRCGRNLVIVSCNTKRVPNGRPHVFVRSVQAGPNGSEIDICSTWGDRRFLLPLPGAFNVANAIIVLAVMLDQGIALDDACDVLSEVEAPPGRMQPVSAGADGCPSVYIDYAHTPAALELALKALRPHTGGKLWCVFGAGGDRDQGKRPLMGNAAERFADFVVVTNDNPRHEVPSDIIAAIVAGMNDPANALVIEDRAAAIAWVIKHAAADDTILVAGRGHESHQVVGDRHVPLSDFIVAAASIGLRNEAGAR